MEQKKKKFVPPTIGMRIMKSAIGVFLCYVIDFFRAGSGMVFYSQLAVLWCMQEHKKATLAQAKQRILGTFIGAFYGLIILLLSREIAFQNVIFENLFWALCISGFIILILYFTVVIDKKQASYFSCVVFLSIVVNHMSDANPYLFVWNRVLDTIIGIGLGVFVNAFGLPREHKNNILFVSGLDDTLLSKESNLTDYSRVELNRMIESGAKFTVSTMRTPASLMDPLRNIDLNLPVIVMDGAALYDIRNKCYLFKYVISHESAQKVINILDDMGCDYFTNVIMDDLLVIYYQESTSEFYNQFVQKLRVSPYRNYVQRALPAGEPVVYFLLLDQKEFLQQVYNRLQSDLEEEHLKILFYDAEDYPGYAYIKIYNHNATRENMLYYLRKYVDVDEIITFGSIEGRYTHCIQKGDSNQVVKLMRKEYEPLKIFQRKNDVKRN